MYTDYTITCEKSNLLQQGCNKDNRMYQLTWTSVLVFVRHDAVNAPSGSL